MALLALYGLVGLVLMRQPLEHEISADKANAAGNLNTYNFLKIAATNRPMFPAMV